MPKINILVFNFTDKADLSLSVLIIRQLSKAFFFCLSVHIPVTRVTEMDQSAVFGLNLQNSMSESLLDVLFSQRNYIL